MGLHPGLLITFVIVAVSIGMISGQGQRVTRPTPAPPTTVTRARTTPTRRQPIRQDRTPSTVRSQGTTPGNRPPNQRNTPGTSTSMRPTPSRASQSSTTMRPTPSRPPLEINVTTTTRSTPSPSTVRTTLSSRPTPTFTTTATTPPFSPTSTTFIPTTTPSTPPSTSTIVPSTSTTVDTTTSPSTLSSTTSSTTVSTSTPSTSTPSTTTPSTTTPSTTTPPTSTTPSTSTTTSSTTTTPSTTSLTPSTPTPSTSTTSLASSTPSPVTTTRRGGTSGGPLTHVQIMFCQMYEHMFIPRDNFNEWLRYVQKLTEELGLACTGPPDRFDNLIIRPDPETHRVVLQFDVKPGPGLSSTEIVEILDSHVNTRQLHLWDMYGNPLNLEGCEFSTNPIYPWTDYGVCPHQRCQFGICRVNFTGHYYCECPEGTSGNPCKAIEQQAGEEMNLLWLLLLIPGILGLLLLLLCCCYCWRNQCCWFGTPPSKVEVVEENVYHGADCDTRSVRSCRSGRSCRSAHSCRSTHSCRSGHSCRSQPPLYTVVANPPMAVNDPGSTYYAAAGRPFAVAFTDNTFSAIGYATSDVGLYNTTGQKMLPASVCGDDEIQVITTGGGGSCCGGSVYSDSASAYKHGVAYNDRTFNSCSTMPNEKTYFIN